MKCFQAGDKKQADQQHRQGLELLRRQSGQRTHDLEQAIVHLQAAREAYRRSNLPELEAIVANDLAQVFRLRQAGDPSANQEQAIDLYRAAQRVLTQAKHPLEWAIIQFNLGNLYLERIEGERAENQRQAKACYDGALAVVSQKETPYQWAKIHNGLAVYYLQAVSGQRAQNVELALVCLNEASKVLQPAQHLADWAEVQNNLNIAWRYRMAGKRADNLEHAIGCAQAALARLHPSQQRRLWGDLQHNLGISFGQRLEGARLENLQKAEEHLRLALQARESAGLAVEAVRTWRELFSLQWSGQWGDQGLQVEQAIQTLEQLVSEAQLSPLERARVELTLGMALIHRVRGDRALNIEKAIDWLNRAAAVIRVEVSPAEWCDLAAGLAAAHRERPLGDRLLNLNQAIACLEPGLQMLLERGWLVHWARAQNNLAGAFWERGRYQRDVTLDSAQADADLGRAIGCAQKAARCYSRQHFPFEWALARYTMGNALSDLSTRKSCERRWRRALAFFQDALQVYNDPAWALRRAWALNDYGVTLLNLARVSPENLAWREVSAAIDLFQQAIAAHQHSGLRAEVLRSRINLGSLHHALGQWPEAYQALRLAVQGIESLHADALGEPGRAHIAERYTLAYRWLVDTCVRRGQAFWPEAITHLEASKGRAFLAEMGTADYPVPAVLPPDVARQERDMLGDLRHIAAELVQLEGAWIPEAARSVRRNELFRRQECARERYDGLLNEVSSLAPEYVALRRGEPIVYSAIQSLLDETQDAVGVIELFPVGDRLLAFVLRQGWDKPRVIPIELDERSLKARHLEPFEPVLDGVPTRAWMGDLGDRLFSEAWAHLEGIDLLVLVPSGGLYGLPLHALPVGNRSLIECVPVVYAPSLAILSRMLLRSRQSWGQCEQDALVVANPGGWPEDELASLAAAEPIARRVAQRFRVQAVLRHQATRPYVLDRLPSARVAFFYCHGHFDRGVPLNSGLYLTRTAGQEPQEDILTVREIMRLRLQAELVVLSACQSGRNLVRRGDELIGLTRAFLYAGAAAVVVALWSVRERAAAALMDDFFDRLYPQGHKKGQAAAALQAACLGLCRSAPYQDFFDWSPFVLVGDWR
ncbi:MAG: CHAT domain-containing protein [Chloroflexota bacterium]